MAERGAGQVPQRWDEITALWLTNALQARHPGVEVSDVSVLMQDDGTNRRARFGLRYAHGEGPRSLFLKAHAAAHRQAHLRNGNLWNEARLFANEVELPLEHPAVHKAIVDADALDFLLVMEDLDLRGADARDATRPYNAAQVANGLEGLARLHSRYWGFDPTADERLGWLQTWMPTEGWQTGLRKHVPIGLQRLTGKLPAAIAHQSADELLACWTAYVSTLAKAPVTLLHGDAHIGNTYVLPDGTVGFLDWQVARRGSWSQDVGYFIVGALSVDDRRRFERELVETYRRALRVPEAQLPSSGAAWDAYRMTPAYGLTVWLSTAGTDGYQRAEVSQALCERYAAAFVELDTISALQRNER